MHAEGEERTKEIQPGCVVTWADYMFAGCYSTAIIVQIDEEGGVYKGGRSVHLYPTRHDFPQERPGGDEVIFIEGRLDIQSSLTYISNIDKRIGVPLLGAAYKYGTLMSKEAIDAASAMEIKKAKTNGDRNWRYMAMPCGNLSNVIYQAYFKSIGFTDVFMKDKHAGMANVLFTTFGGVTGASTDITGSDNLDERSGDDRGIDRVGALEKKTQKQIEASHDVEASQSRSGGNAKHDEERQLVKFGQPTSSATSRRESGGSGVRDRDANDRNRSGALSATKKGKPMGRKNTAWSAEQIPLLALPTSSVSKPGALMAKRVSKYGGFNWVEKSRNGRVTDDSYNVVSEI